MNNLTPEIIAKAKEAKSPEELLALAKENNINMTQEEAVVCYAQLNPKAGEIADDELDNVSGGACKTTVDGEKRTVVSSGLQCFTGKYECAYYIDENYNAVWKREDNTALRWFWDGYCCTKVVGDTCGSCLHLEFKNGTGYCGVS